MIATGMAKDPDNRYATTVELADAAHDAITTPPPLRKSPRRTSRLFHTRPKNFARQQTLLGGLAAERVIGGICQVRVVEFCLRPIAKPYGKGAR